MPICSYRKNSLLRARQLGISENHSTELVDTGQSSERQHGREIRLQILIAT